MKGLSELSRTYMTYIDDIRAGERALADDVGRVLAEVARGRTDGTALTTSALEQRREVEGVVFTHRITWEPREGWPAASFEAKGDTSLFEPSFLGEAQLVQPDRDALLVDAVGELTRTWDENRSRVDTWFQDGRVRERVAALSILREVSRHIRAALKPKPSNISQNAGKVSGYVGNNNFPAYIEWYDQEPVNNKRISWEIVYHYEARSNRPAGLHLVCFMGNQVLAQLEGQPILGSYANHPILAAWPEHLAAVTAGEQSGTEAARAILAQAARIYAGYRARLNGATA